MKFVDEYRDRDRARELLAAISETATRAWTLMEVCGGQTHAIVKYGLDRLLPASVSLLHGPGCPVCVTPVAVIDLAIALAGRPGVTLCTFGDMLRVPGSLENLMAARARGGDVRIVYSPLDAFELARAHPDRQFVFLAVGFETTAPTTAMAVRAAADARLENFSLLVAHVLVPPALEIILSGNECRVDGFLAAGHVCTIMGLDEYRSIAAKHGVPIVATGFEPLDILEGVLMAVRQLEAGRAEVENQYARAVRHEGNAAAKAMIAEIFEPSDRDWRGVGPIAASGLALRPKYAPFDAARKFDLAVGEGSAEDIDDKCLAGRVLRGLSRPSDCPSFGTACTPEHPIGAPMVSAEGACAAYFRHRRIKEERREARV